jgi:hypothetical protein
MREKKKRADAEGQENYISVRRGEGGSGGGKQPLISCSS